VGDERQIQPIEAGSPFKAIASIVGEVRLTSIRRQKEEWARQAVHDFAGGNAHRALREYASRGFLSVKGTRREAKHALIKDWRREGIENPAQNLILASTNAEVLELNRLAQDERRKALIIRGEFTTVGENFIYEGDRVLFTRRSKGLGVENGSFATVDRIRNGILSATLDNGNSVEIPIQKYQDILLGYAVTTHKAQGITVDNARVLLGGPMQDREISYVQASRARSQTHFYVEKEKAGKDLATIAATMERSREKKMAIDLLPPREKEKDEFRYKHKLH
jgi:ATP-dependent exoDNAse (exonuclease V) alpha subunit